MRRAGLIHFLPAMVCLLTLLSLLSVRAHAQDDDDAWLRKKHAGAVIVAPAITVEATCSGTGNTRTVPCSSAMTVTAGDTIACEGSTTGFDPMTLFFNDIVNGTYDNIEGIVHPSASTTWSATAVFQNSAGGSITPQINNWEPPAELNLKCRALKGTRTTLVLDSGAVNQTNSATAANPTSGTAAAPTNNNEIVIGGMTRASVAATSDSAPWVPGSTITAVGSNLPLYDHYQIQTSASAVNSPMTSVSAAFTDSQYAVLNSANPAGARGITGFYGVPAIAKTNGSSVTAADLGGATTTLATILANTNWALTGTAATYDTSVSPSGTGRILAQGISHTFGDAATSVHFTGAQTANSYAWVDEISANGYPLWFSSFFRMGSSGTVSGQLCDSFEIGTGVTINHFWIQPQFNTGTGLEFALESSEGTGLSPFLSGFSLDTDYRLQLHIAGASERNHQLIVQSKSGGVWSVAGTLNYDVLCAPFGPNCTTPPATGSGTGSASSGSTSLTITSATGTIAAGQIVVPQTGIAYLTDVESISGTCSSSCTITLSQNTTASISGTVNFVTAPSQFHSATNGTASAGSTALTVVVPAFPASTPIAVGDAVGGPGFANGTVTIAVSGGSVTLNQPTTAAISNGGVWFWTAGTGGNSVTFGKFSSCTVAGDEWFSGMHFDPVGDWGAYVPN